MSLRAAVEIARLAWQAARGYRWRPWRSPYLRWRIETYSGQDADTVDAGAFCRFLWRERRRLAAYLRWSGAMRVGEGRPAKPPQQPGGR